MFELVKAWYIKKFSDPHSVTLLLMLVATVALLYFFGSYVMPVLVAIVIAYLLEWPVNKLTRVTGSRVLSAVVVMAVFVGITLGLVFGIVPVLWQQLSNLLQESPTMVEEGKDFLLHLPEYYPTLISTTQVQAIVTSVENKLLELGEVIVSASLTSLRDVVAWMIYLVLVPLLAFFMLKDKSELTSGISKIIPKDRKLISQVWHEMDQQIMNYIRGKVFEIVIVGLVSFVTFSILELRYAALLGTLVGLSVLIPFVGAALVTLPVAAVALFQFGLAPEFWTIVIAYSIIQALDGNVLVPLLFSEAVDLNPVYIIVAVLFFGGPLGFLGGVLCHSIGVPCQSTDKRMVE